ncbi:MAG: hypothetical protein FJX57_00365 [Alphaproteobacteria bacterium]|nr:hypothetical protein [Alphaproteobacteria bacterium]
MRKRKTWREKLEDAQGLPKVERLTGRMRERWGAGTIVIPAPLEVDALMRRVRPGRVVTLTEIRAALARKHGATMGCPFTTGIFALIAARAAAEDETAGKRRVTPYWRTLKGGGELNEKYPGGIEAQRAQLEREGHAVITRGKRRFVEDYEKRLAPL